MTTSANLNTYQILNAVYFCVGSLKELKKLISQNNEYFNKIIITEKMTEASETFNRYGFIVDKNANKIQIKGAVEEAAG